MNMAIYDVNGNVISAGGESGDSFYTVTDITVDLLTMTRGTTSESNTEEFQTDTGSYPIVDYFAYADSYITILQYLNSNQYGTKLAFYDSSKTLLSAVIWSAYMRYLDNETYKAYVYAIPTGTAYVRVQYRASTNTKYFKYAPINMKSFDDLTQMSWVSGYKFKTRMLLGIPSIDSTLNGKNVYCLGDSITENNSHNNNKSWAEYLDDIFGLNVYNKGLSGTGLVKGYGSNRGICNNIDNNATYFTDTPDLILIMGNGNDATTGSFYDYSGNSTTVTNSYGAHVLPIGTSSDTSSTLSVYGAMKHMLEALIIKYPTAKIGFITSTPRLQDLSSLWGADKGHFYGHGAFDDYVTAIKWVCEEYNVPCLDLYHNTVLRPWNTTNASTFYADSSIHPNTLGTVEGIVKPVARWIVENFC